MLKLLIRDLLDEGISLWNIMYYAFDMEGSPKELVALIKIYFDNAKIQRQDKRCYLILDEIPSIKNWQKGIKRLWDQNRLKGCTIVATGSHAVDLRLSAEKLPGRRGDHADMPDKIMPPMKFSEFASAVDAELKEITDLNFLKRSERMSMLDHLFHGQMPEATKNIQAYLPELNLCLQDYVLTCGVPKAINQYVSAKTVSEGTYADHLNAILGDPDTLNRSDGMFRQLTAGIIKSIGQTSSWRSLKKDTDVAAEGTVSQYAAVLQDMFVCCQARAVMCGSWITICCRLAGHVCMLSGTCGDVRLMDHNMLPSCRTCLWCLSCTSTTLKRKRPSIEKRKRSIFRIRFILAS